MPAASGSFTRRSASATPVTRAGTGRNCVHGARSRLTSRRRSWLGTGGGWIVPDRWSYQGGALYSTSMAVLTLEVYYRFANAFGSKAATVKAK